MLPHFPRIPLTEYKKKIDDHLRPETNHQPPPSPTQVTVSINFRRYCELHSWSGTMPSFAVTPSVHLLGVGLVLLLLIVRPARAFGAGNIASVSKIEGQNWRHGDIEDTLLTLLMSRAAGGKKFGKLDVKRVYFGNWYVRHPSGPERPREIGV